MIQEEIDMENCLFCKIAAGQIPSTKVYEDDQVLAFRDIAPQAPTHVLFIPKTPIATLNDLQPEHAELVGRLILAAAAHAKELGLAEDGYRVVMNCNQLGGQTVYHIHLHLLAGRQLHWPPG